jgi:integrase
MKEEAKKPRRANGDGSFYHRKDGRVEYKNVVGIASDGSYIRKSFYGATEAECRDLYKKYLKDNPVPLEKIKTMGELAKNWLPIYKKGKISDGTYYEYELIINNVIIPNIGKVKLPELRRAHVEQMMRTVSGFSASRQKKVCFLTKAILETAVEDRYCRENVAAKVTPPKAVKKEIEIYTTSEIKKLFAHEHPFLPYAALLFLTGMRRGELLALSWRNVDFAEGFIRVKQALSDGQIKDKTKGKKDRLIPIYPELKSALEAIPKTALTVFTSDGIHPMNKDQFNWRFKAFVKSAGVEYKSPHKCRHSFITYMLKSNVPLHIVQAIAGHENMEMTERYTHVNTEDLKDNIVRLKF